MVASCSASGDGLEAARGKGDGTDGPHEIAARMEAADALHRALEEQRWPAAWSVLKGSRSEAKKACRRRSAGLYPLHLALIKRAPPALTLKVLKYNENACRIRAAGDRLPLHHALINWEEKPAEETVEQEEAVGAILVAFPEACREREPVHHRLPLHWALRKKVPDELTLQILRYYPEACQEKDLYERLPLHLATIMSARVVNAGAIMVVDGCHLVTYSYDKDVRAKNEHRKPSETQVGDLLDHPDEGLADVLERVLPSHSSAGGPRNTDERVTLALLKEYEEACHVADITRKKPTYLAVRSATGPVRQAIEDAAQRSDVARITAVVNGEVDDARQARLAYQKEMKEEMDAKERVVDAERELKQAQGDEEHAQKKCSVAQVIVIHAEGEATAAAHRFDAVLLGPKSRERGVLLAEATAAKEEAEKELQRHKMEFSYWTKEDVDAKQLQIEKQDEVDELRVVYEREALEALEAEQRLILQEAEAERERENARSERQRLEKERALRELEISRADMVAAKFADAWHKWSQSLLRLQETEAEIEARERESRAHGLNLLQDELTDVHQMHEETWEAVRTKMKDWQELYEREAERNVDHPPVFKLDDLIAVWVYSMGPGAPCTPNFCACGYQILSETNPKAAKAQACECKPSGKNFRLCSSFNGQMRGQTVPDTCGAQYKWFHYHLDNAVEHVPGAQENEKLFRGQGGLYGEEYKKGDVGTQAMHGTT